VVDKCSLTRALKGFSYSETISAIFIDKFARLDPKLKQEILLKGLLRGADAVAYSLDRILDCVEGRTDDESSLLDAWLLPL